MEKFCFCFKKFWNKSKRFGFVLILSFDIGTFVLSFLSVSGSGSRSESFYETVAEEWVYNTLTASTTLSLQRPWECFRGCESVSRGREITLSWPQLTFSGTSSSLSRPLKHLKASIDTLTAFTDTLTASTDTLTASTDPLTASKALSRPLQSTSTLLACNIEFTRTFSRLWECCWGRESVVYSRSLFGLPYNHYGHSHGLY